MGSEMSPFMVPLPSEVRIESFILLPTVKPPGSGNTLFLGRAGILLLLSTAGAHLVVANRHLQLSHDLLNTSASSLTEIWLSSAGVQLNSDPSSLT
ncbi:hypothetical protein NL676_003974 [Syzygium grande]|nr:hypothetical protein NL676_003974 [Syzygium grande]